MAKISDPITLEEPIVRGETETIKELKLRKPAGGELRGLTLVDLTQLKTDTVIKLLPRITMPSITDIEATMLDPADLLQCGVEIANFFLTAEMRAASPDL
jgi:Phage tail assembly chaperone proteins, E, or 41 or 14